MELAKMYIQEYNEIVRKHNGKLSDMSVMEIDRLSELSDIIAKARKRSVELVLKA